MLFNSIEFLIFLPLVVLAHYATPQRFRYLLLLAASYCFYGWFDPAYTLILAFSTLVDYVAGLRMARFPTRAERKPYLILSLSLNLSLLFAFKYFYFFAETMEPPLRWLGVNASLPERLLLPIGISFYTFQTIAYSVDVYRGKLIPERNLGYFALYVSFFPQLVAGPIERARNLLPQLRRTVPAELDAAAEGLTRILWGLFKKLFIADRLAIYVDHVYGAPANHTATSVVIATALFYFQLYCDFSGYTDIAIGSALFFRVRLVENFRRPYMARTIAEGWTRWHISLSTWFRDYVFIPLAQRLGRDPATSAISRPLALGIVFVLIGVWHGADATFVIFGFIHATYMIAGRATGKLRDRLWNGVGSFVPAILRARVPLQVLITFALATFAMLFFRAANLSDAILLLGALGRWEDSGLTAFMAPGAYELVLALAGLAVLCVVDYAESRQPLWETIRAWPTWLRWSSAYAIAILIMMFGVTTRQNFAYFQF